ncbi:MAG: DUF169 domain-containing protein [Candidatus Omnitrophica bacterium]|nr:DUF169 domain-containing protein [Candidatus Omnitrophota bacterium]MDD5351700.1 DUF169 domain-containing protein [Candidatus Omnitrophota bacterium]MDD5550910.1 DUF169 domain-containing protein [Candidatus Omnitrophota bacterium]
MDKSQLQEYSRIFKEIFNLQTSPVAIRCVKAKNVSADESKVRICRAILDAAKGQTSEVCRENNACFGANWHLGFSKIDDPKAIKMIKQFVVEGEKLFSSYEALDKLLSQIEDVPDNKDMCFVLSPLENTDSQPQLVVFVCNPEQACRLLTFVTFIDGVIPKIKIGGPTCRMAIMYPLISSEVNVSFQDYTARKLCKMDKDKLLVSIPFRLIPTIIGNIDKCSAGTAKVEYPQEFREFLQKKMSVKK